MKSDHQTVAWLRYVPFDDVDRYLASGWIVVSGLYGNHGAYAILMRYDGDDDPVEVDHAR